MKKIYLLFFVFIGFVANIQAQSCAQVESVLVDACGSPEGRNEMFRFKVGANDLNTANLTVTWSSNP
ncbi:MAG TPA: hypothetical protein VG603_08190, partial [Chitinophagales bacterium]|nr:hypothetical protein [Chitinophagales bacterium]